VDVRIEGWGLSQKMSQQLMSLSFAFLALITQLLPSGQLTQLCCLSGTFTSSPPGLAPPPLQCLLEGISCP
jgi:hypothetical protein